MHKEGLKCEEVTFHSLGTEINIKLILDDPDRDSIQKVQDDFQKIKDLYLKEEKILSRFRRDSELSAINSNLGAYQEASSEIIYLLRKCLEYHSQTKKIFDPRIIDILEDVGYRQDFKTADFSSCCVRKDKVLPSGDLASDIRCKGEEVYLGHRVDLGGIAKGYITDRAADLLREEGWHDFLIDSGGDVFTSGKDETCGMWRIEIEGLPDEKLVLCIGDGAMATSGVSRRKWENHGEKFHHLINPKEPYSFSFGLRSVTVAAKKCEEADVWAKALFLSGSEDGRKLADEKNIAAVFIDRRGNATLTRKMSEYIIR